MSHPTHLHTAMSAHCLEEFFITQRFRRDFVGTHDTAMDPPGTAPFAFEFPREQRGPGKAEVFGVVVEWRCPADGISQREQRRLATPGWPIRPVDGMYNAQLNQLVRG